MNPAYPAVRRLFVALDAEYERKRVPLYAQQCAASEAYARAQEANGGVWQADHPLLIEMESAFKAYRALTLHPDIPNATDDELRALLPYCVCLLCADNGWWRWLGLPRFFGCPCCYGCLAAGNDRTNGGKPQYNKLYLAAARQYAASIAKHQK